MISNPCAGEPERNFHRRNTMARTDFTIAAEERGPISSDLMYGFAHSGGTLVGGQHVYRGDDRTMSEIQAAGGFIPSSILRDGETLVAHARWQANEILNCSNAADFVMLWKQPRWEGRSLEPLIKGKEGKMSGVACGIGAAQKGGYHFRITLPRLHALAVNCKKDIAKICIYGDGDSLDTSTSIWMNLIPGKTADEFVSLTAIPIGWIEQI